MHVKACNVAVVVADVVIVVVGLVESSFPARTSTLERDSVELNVAVTG